MKSKTAFIVPVFTYKNDSYQNENFEKFRNKNVWYDNMFVIELAFGDSQFRIPESEKFIRLRADKNTVIWQKERLINIAIKKIPKKFEYISWVDADIIFSHPLTDWAIANRLQKHSVIQLFETVRQLDERGCTYKVHNNCFVDERKGWTGYGWAIRRDVLNKIGGLFDYHITGNGDCLLAGAFTGNLKNISQRTLNNCSHLKKLYTDYYKLCQKHITSASYLKDRQIEHLYHGNYNRKYEFREKLLERFNFNPSSDLKTDVKTGLLQWSANKKLRGEVLSYHNTMYNR